MTASSDTKRSARDTGMTDLYLDPKVDTPEDRIVEIAIGPQGELWVNVGGLCRLRVKGQPKEIWLDQPQYATKKLWEHSRG